MLRGLFCSESWRIVAMAGVTDSDREADLRALAERMRFHMENAGDRFTLTRIVELPESARETNLTLDEVQEVSTPGSCAACAAVEALKGRALRAWPKTRGRALHRGSAALA